MKKTLILLTFIILLAFSLRFYQVTNNPPSLNWDEVAIGYNAYSIMKTGHDEWGAFLPVHFKSYGEYKLPFQIYASIPGIWIFGLNELGVRITPVVYGTLTVLLLFLLTRIIFLSTTIGLIAAFLLAISPWHIQLTRGSFESSFAVFWIVLAVWLLIKGFQEAKYLFFSTIAFAIAIYTYNSARVFVPFFMGLSLIIYKNNFIKYKKALIISVITFVILMVPLIMFVLSGEGSARYKLVSITDDPGLVLRINEQRGNSKLPEPLPRLIYNKATFISVYFTRNYLSHFSPQFLFVSGAPHKQHHVQGIGELYWFQLPFLIIGLIYLFKNKNKYRGLLLGWMLLAYIPVSITNDSIPHALRTLIAVPTYQVITAYGLYLVFQWLPQKQIYRNGFIVLISGIIMLSVSYYLHLYYTKYPYLYSKDWQYGYKQVVDFVNEQSSKYDLIVFTRHYGEPHMFMLFFSKYDPGKFQNDPNLVRFETHDWVRVLNFNKYYFPDLGDAGTRYSDIKTQHPDQKILFIGKPGDFPDDVQRLKKVNFLNGDEGFEIVE